MFTILWWNRMSVVFLIFIFAIKSFEIPIFDRYATCHESNLTAELFDRCLKCRTKICLLISFVAIFFKVIDPLNREARAKKIRQ